MSMNYKALNNIISQTTKLSSNQGSLNNFPDHWNYWYIWSNEHNGWWAPDQTGYVKKLSEAGIYPLHQADNICIQANKYQKDGEMPNETMVRAVINK